MRSAAQIIQVEMRDLQIQGRAQITQDVAVLGKGKNNGDTGGFAARNFDAGNVNARLREALDTELPEGILSDARRKADATTQERQVVGKDGGGAAEGHSEIVGEMLALGLEGGRQTVQDQVGIEFSDDADLEALHS